MDKNVYRVIFDNPAQKFVYRGDFGKHALPPRHKSLLYTPLNRGLPIGNLTSQFFANVYLDMLDQFIKRTLKVKGYVRYVDDFILFGDSRQTLLAHKRAIETFLAERLKLQLRDAFRLRPVESGIDFLGYIIRPRYTLVRNRVVNNFKFKKAQFLEKAFGSDGTCSLGAAGAFKQVNASYYGHFKHANSFRLMEKYRVKEWL